MIDDNRDLTFTPRIFSENEALFQNEYRQVEKNLNHISDFSVKKSEQNSKTHFFSNTKIMTESDKFESSFDHLRIYNLLLILIE